MTDTFITYDERFRSLVIGSAELERLWTGGRWTEGPVYVPAARFVLWSDIPNDRVMRYDECDGSVAVFAGPCGFHNGHTLDGQGRVVACEHGERRVSRLDHDGVWRELIGRVGEKRLNSPNDVVVKSDGTVWFTDPTYGIDSHYEGHRAAPDLPSRDVYRFDPANGALAAVVTGLGQPNGLCFSPDERILYVSDTGRSHDPACAPVIRAYPMAADGASVGGEARVFARATDGVFDGFRSDDRGNIWTSDGEGVSVFAPDGTRIGAIAVGETVSNLCFGGPKRNRLFITAKSSLYAVFVNAHAVGWRDEC